MAPRRTSAGTKPPSHRNIDRERGGHSFSLGTADFDTDGFADLAVGVPFEGVGVAGHAGAVNVLYGSAVRLQAASPDDQLWSQDAGGVRDAAEENDAFGALASQCFC